VVDQLELSQYELWYLLSQQTPVIILGFTDPTQGYLTEDLFPLIQESSQALIDKDYISLNEQNQIVINPKIRQLLTTITSPKHTIVIGCKLDEGEKEEVQSINISNDKVVLLKRQSEHAYILKEIQSRIDLLSIASIPFINKIFYAPDTENLEMSQDALTDIQDHVQSGDLDKARALLEQVGGDSDSKDHIWMALQNPQIKFSLVGFFNRDDTQKERVDGFSVITDQRYLWMIEEVDENRHLARVSKSTLKMLKNKIDGLIPQFNL
jgi:hypothetical protein